MIVPGVSTNELDPRSMMREILPVLKIERRMGFQNKERQENLLAEACGKRPIDGVEAGGRDRSCWCASADDGFALLSPYIELSFLIPLLNPPCVIFRTPYIDHCYNSPIPEKIAHS